MNNHYLLKKLNLTYKISILIFCSLLFVQDGYCTNNYYFHAIRYLQKLKQKPTKFTAVVKISDQSLELFNGKKLIKKYKVSTSKRGAGQLINSRKTPIGLHKIIYKLGKDQPHYAIYKHGKFTDKVWPKSTPRRLHKRDHIVTRVVVLDGLEPGINKGRNKNQKIVDSQRRGILLHGTTMEWKLGNTASIGCVHLSSKDIVHFYNTVPNGSLVLIIP